MRIRELSTCCTLFCLLLLFIICCCFCNIFSFKLLQFLRCKVTWKKREMDLWLIACPTDSQKTPEEDIKLKVLIELFCFSECQSAFQHPCGGRLRLLQLPVASGCSAALPPCCGEVRRLKTRIHSQDPFGGNHSGARAAVCAGCAKWGSQNWWEDFIIISC